MKIKGITMIAALCDGTKHFYNLASPLTCICGKYRLVWQGPDAPWKMLVRDQEGSGWSDFAVADMSSLTDPGPIEEVGVKLKFPAERAGRPS